MDAGNRLRDALAGLNPLQGKPVPTPNTPEPSDLEGASRGQSAILQAEVEDLERELRAVRKKKRWHLIWALTGVSPAALIVATGLFLQGHYGLVVPVVLLAAAWQFFLGVKTTREEARMEKALKGLLERE